MAMRVKRKASTQLDAEMQRFKMYTEDATYMRASMEEFIDKVDPTVSDEEFEMLKANIILERQRLDDGVRIYLRMLQRAQMDGVFMQVRLPERMKKYLAQQSGTDIQLQWMSIHVLNDSQWRLTGSTKLRRLRECASQGDMFAQLDLAATEDTFLWLRAASEQGHPVAQRKLGCLYECDPSGLVQQDLVESKRLYELAAVQGDAVAQNHLAYLYQRGHGVERNYEEAKRLYEMAVEQGYSRAQNNLGYMFQHGQGVKQDSQEAKRLFELSAAQGNPDAQTNLGCLYELGRGVEQNFNEAKRLFELAILSGNTAAQNNLGFMYQSGRGVEQNFEQAHLLYRMGAANGNSAAQNNLGYLYQYGHGVEKDYVEARRLYELAAAQGNPNAQNNLAFLHQYGLGVEQDHEEAKRLFGIAAAQGDPVAQYNLRCLLDSSVTKH